ncbi:uncharacterized protein LOC143280108 [Babylonia areolata]|uniref:uncharacterized protein LOC143280108 n=1 Tax=Babylonia areolata TaxID=304850 RepID=UPI003FD118F9
MAKSGTGSSTGSRKHHRQTQHVPTGADTVRQMVAVQAVLHLDCHDQEHVIRKAQRMLQQDSRPSPSHHRPPPPHSDVHQAGFSSTQQGTLTAAALLLELESQAMGDEEVEEGDDDEEEEAFKEYSRRPKPAARACNRNDAGRGVREKQRADDPQRNRTGSAESSFGNEGKASGDSLQPGSEAANNLYSDMEKRASAAKEGEEEEKEEEEGNARGGFVAENTTRGQRTAEVSTHAHSPDEKTGAGEEEGERSSENSFRGAGDEAQAADAESPNHRSPGSPGHRKTPHPHTHLSGHARDLVTDSHEPQLPPACDREGCQETTFTPPAQSTKESISTTMSEKLAAEDSNQQQATTASTKPAGDAESTPPSAQRTLAQRVEALRRENARLKALRTCRHCRIRPVNLTLLPCGHFCLCEECGAAFSKCPVCFKTVLADVKTFVA